MNSKQKGETPVLGAIEIGSTSIEQAMSKQKEKALINNEEKHAWLNDQINKCFGSRNYAELFVRIVGLHHPL